MKVQPFSQSKAGGIAPGCRVQFRLTFKAISGQVLAVQPQGQQSRATAAAQFCHLPVPWGRRQADPGKGCQQKGICPKAIGTRRLLQTTRKVCAGRRNRAHNKAPSQLKRP